jgi:hypothetical protein
MQNTQINFSQGKQLAVVTETSLVKSYAAGIGEGWRRLTQDVMKVAQLCFEANERLSATQKKELIGQLPFKQAAFSKLSQIGKDTRLHAPEMVRLLPPHYTIVYMLTQLTDDELATAAKERVIHPDMNRANLQKWLNSCRDQNVPEPKRATRNDHMAFADLEVAWCSARQFKAAWAQATDLARERFVCEVLGVRLARPARRSAVQ